MLFTVVTIFPEIFPGALEFGLSGKALGVIWNLQTVNIREFASDKHKTVDDIPYGGGAGMVMKPDVVHAAMTHALSLHKNTPQIFFMSPRGVALSQKKVADIMGNKQKDGVIILCGRYEGVDERLIQHWKKYHGMLEISIGDYILFGGEIPAMVLIDSCLRMVSGIMNNSESIEHESFSVDLLEHPQYTRPAVWNEENVPSVLLSGNHGKIAKWRLERAEQTTKDNRPDLWKKYVVDREMV